MGEGEGLGYTVNVPLPYAADDRIYLKAFNEIAVPIICQYKPQFILVSTGFDNHYTDPVGNLIASSHSYTKIFDTTSELASKFCQGKLVAVLEGGYNLRFLGKLACVVTARLAGISYSIRDKRCGAVLKVRRKGDKMIEQAKKTQTQFWNLN